MRKKNRKYTMFLLFTKWLRGRIWPAGYSWRPLT